MFLYLQHEQGINFKSCSENHTIDMHPSEHNEKRHNILFKMRCETDVKETKIAIQGGISSILIT